MDIDLQVPIWTIDHVAVAIHLSVETAREYTYRPDFPAPAAVFSKNLWLREDVLAWFARLPKKDRKSARTRNTTKRLVLTKTGVAMINSTPEPAVRPYKPRTRAGR